VLYLILVIVLLILTIAWLAVYGASLYDRGENSNARHRVGCGLKNVDELDEVLDDSVVVGE